MQRFQTKGMLDSPILQEAHDSITPQEHAAFELNYGISERIYQILKEKGMSKRDLARLTGKKESEVSRWFSFGHNFTCKTIAMIQVSLGEPIIEIAVVSTKSGTPKE